MTSWYALTTFRHQEWLAKASCEAEGFETLLLWYWKLARHARQEQKTKRVLFPGYILVGCQKWHNPWKARCLHGVTDILCTNGQPGEIEERAILDLQHRGDKEGQVELTEQQRGLLRDGTMVKVLTGAFLGHIGHVKLDKGATIDIWLNLFGRRFEAAYSPEELEIVSPGRRAR